MKRLEAMRVFVGLSFALASALHSSVADASCKDSCDSGFSSASSCWCDDLCSGYGDCCVDYAAQCLAPPVPACQAPLRAWKPATLLQSRPPFATLGRTYPDIGLAADGSAIAVWQTWDPAPTGFRGVRGRHFSGGAWAPALDLASGAGNVASARRSAVRIAVGAEGHAFVTLPSGTMKRFLPLSGWSSLAAIGFPAVRTSLGRGVDGAGSLAYLYESGGLLSVRRFAAVWQVPDSLGLPTPSPDLAVNASGDFGAIFNPSYSYVLRRDEPEGGAFTARATHLTASSGRVGVADDGTVLGVWLGEGNTVQFARLDTISITPAVTIAAYAVGELHNLRLAVNGAGQAIASWVHLAAFGYEVVAALYNPSTGWSAPTTLAPSAFSTLIGPPNQEVGIDGCGAAHLIHEDLRYQAHAFSYRPGVGWSPRHTFAGPALDIRIATAVNGVATAVWDNDQNEVLAARFE